MPHHARRAAGLLGILALAATLRAQEPRPADLIASYISDPSGVDLDFAWRFAPGDEPGRESPDLDDRSWVPVRPRLAAEDLPGGGWPGVGWFRRHLIIEADLQHRPLALRFTAPGAADVYLDGRLVLACGRGGASPEVPYPDRSDAALIRFEGPRHVLAVRYAYPAAGSPGTQSIGYRLTLADPALAPRAAGRPLAGGEGALAALPFFLAFLHLVLFSFSPRARENLFYAVEMGAFTLIVLREYEVNLLGSERARELLDRFSLGAPIVAIVFGLLTYYAVRTDRIPRAWRVFAAGGAVLLGITYLAPSVRELTQDVLFFSVIAEVVRIERGGHKVKRRGARIFLASFAVFGAAVVLQILVNIGVIMSVGGMHAVYILGILASAAGMSSYLAYGVRHSRLIEVEAARKTRELAQARELQLSMLPRELPTTAGLDVAAASYTAAEVGGDYYDLRGAGSNGDLLVAFGDATGHGLASGIVVTAAKALFLSIREGEPLGESLRTCNAVLRDMRLPGFQMCLALARLTAREIAVASAGMPPVLIHRAGRRAIEELAGEGLPLGTRLPARYEERRAPLAPGDTVLFASDGFAELLDPEGGELGYARAAQALEEAAPAATPREILERLSARAADFRRSRPQSDDITFIVIRVAA